MAHDTLGDLAALLCEGETVRLRRDPVQKTWVAALLDYTGNVLDYGESESLEEALAELVRALE